MWGWSLCLFKLEEKPEERKLNVSFPVLYVINPSSNLNWVSLIVQVRWIIAPLLLFSISFCNGSSWLPFTFDNHSVLFAQRSASFSSLDFFLGRIDWLIESKSSLPTTLTSMAWPLVTWSDGLCSLLVNGKIESAFSFTTLSTENLARKAAYCSSVTLVLGFISFVGSSPGTDFK